MKISMLQTTFKKLLTYATTASFALVPSIALVDLEAQAQATTEVDEEVLMQDVDGTTNSILNDTEGVLETDEDVEEDGTVIGDPSFVTREDDGRIILRRDYLLVNEVVIDSEDQVDDATQVQTETELAFYAAGLLLDDENAKKIELGNDEVQLTYRTRARLFGFIPVLVSATATVDEDENVRVDYPWYSFLSSTNRVEIENDITTNLESDDTAEGVNTDEIDDAVEIEDEVAENDDVDDADFSANRRAIVLMHMHSAMLAHFETGTADIEAEGTSDADVEIESEI
jgi:hypothetical protein